MQIPESILSQIEGIRLPFMPQVLLRLLDMVDDDQASLTELATLVGQDPALSAHFLTVANSPPLRGNLDVKSLADCMTTLGTGLVRTIAESLAIQAGFARTAGEPDYLPGDFWRHSLEVAEMARAIAIRTNYRDSGEAYLAGLLHDIGQLLLLGGVGERYGGWLHNVASEAKLREVEELLFGTDHAAVGAWLVDRWRLSSFLSDAILFHHKSHSEIVDAHPLCKIVWSCQVIGTCSEAVEVPRNESAPDLATVTSLLGLDPTEIAEMRDRSSKRVASLATALGVTAGVDADTPPFPALPPENQQPGQQDHRDAYAEVEARVRDMAIMQSLQRNLSTLCREEEILSGVQEASRILFGLGRLAFFFIEADEPVLSTPDFAGQPALLRQLQIRLDTGRSLAAAAVLAKQPRSTLDDPPAPVSLVDVQVARTLESDGVLYVPMCIRERQIGVMAYGLSASQQARIGKLLVRITSFAHDVAVSLESWRALRAMEEKAASALASRFQQHARKVVHEAGNPLSIIKNYLKIVAQKLPDDDGAGQELDILREEVDRVALILQGLGDLSETAPAAESVDVNGVINGMLALYGESLFSSQGIVVEKDLAPGLGQVRGNRDHIKQILFNLWTNAADVLTRGDRFSISTSDNVVLNGRCYVEIALSDSGPGLPPDIMQRLFQPLDANRRTGHSGIGLSIVASLIESLDGSIKCRSNVGAGTSFVILLPRNMESRNEEDSPIATRSWPNMPACQYP